jgi:hypothetical protein
MQLGVKRLPAPFSSPLFLPSLQPIPTHSAATVKEKLRAAIPWLAKEIGYTIAHAWASENATF